MWYLPFKYYPDSYLFQVLEDSLGLPWFEPWFRYFTGELRPSPACCW